MVLIEVYTASNLTKQEGVSVIAKYSDMMSLLPTIQKSVGNLTETLADEPLLEAFKNYDSLNGMLSCKENSNYYVRNYYKPL